MKTGRDVVIGALLGAEEFGFATAPLVVEGCIMMRKCHLNTCPVGVATQDPVLRAKFSGKPEYVVNFFFYVAEEVREIMAQLGIRTFDELVGRVDLLDTKKGVEHWKAKGLDFRKIFAQPEHAMSNERRQVSIQDHNLGNALDNELISKAASAIESGKKVSFIHPVRNVNRTVGAMLSGEVAKRYGHEGLPDDTIHVQFNGTAGQSFAAFLARGITFDLVGDANDYVGKGLSGGRVIVRTPNEFKENSSENIIVGNTVLYGAIDGEAFFNGVAGERFAVRNSGATAVVEGTGDHGAEYMTGGTIVVLGNTGRNFAAGMSGGIAYVYDADGMFAKRCNTTMATLEKVLPSSEQEKNMPKELWHAPLNVKEGGQRLTDEVILKDLVERHFKHTGSEQAKSLLRDWETARSQFVKVFPTEYKRALGELWAKSQGNQQQVTTA
jgi:glutamate synthase (NADPH/NADH) large chain